MKKLYRIMALSLVLAVALTIGIVAVHAQDEFVVIIGWEQEPDAPPYIGASAFAAYLDEFYGRDVWDWDTERNIYPIMVEEIPTPDNGLVSFVPVEFDIDGDGAMDQVEAPQVTYRLRQGMLWSDGTPITTADCMLYHNIQMQPDPVDSFQRGFYPDVVASAEVVDDYNIVLTYNRPWPDYLSSALLQCGLPAHKFLGDNGSGFTMDADGDGVFDANLDDAPYMTSFPGGDITELVGYGPYIATEFNVGQDMTFERNPNWGVNEWERVPAVDVFVLQFIPESAQMENAMQVGDIDVAFNFDVINNGYGDMENVDTFIVDGVFYDAIWMNSGPFSFAAMQDVRVREGLVAAIDRRGIAEQFAGEGAGALLSRSWFPPQFTDPSLGFREYDVDLARQLLTEAGWIDEDGDEGTTDAPTLRVAQGVEGVADGTTLILRFYTTPVVPRPDIQLVIQAQLRQVGVGTQLFVVAGPTVLFAAFNDRGILYTGNYDLAMYALSNDPLSPNGSVDNFHCSGIPGPENPNGANNTWFCNEEYDRLDDLVTVTNDPTERLGYAYQRDPLFYDAAVWHSIRPRPQAYAFRTDRLNFDSTRNVGTLSNNYFQNVEEWLPAG
jgi:peptide/nickel transport system substrate-binding protein